MANALTSKGQVTVPKRIRDALSLLPGCSSVEFSVNKNGEIVLRKAMVKRRASQSKDRFESISGKAKISGKANIKLRKAATKGHAFQAKDRFEAVRGKANIKWRTDDLMALLRGDE